MKSIYWSSLHFCAAFFFFFNIFKGTKRQRRGYRNWLWEFSDDAQAIIPLASASSESCVGITYEKWRTKWAASVSREPDSYAAPVKELGTSWNSWLLARSCKVDVPVKGGLKGAKTSVGTAARKPNGSTGEKRQFGRTTDGWKNRYSVTVHTDKEQEACYHFFVTHFVTIFVVRGEEPLSLDDWSCLFWTLLQVSSSIN